MTPSDPLLEKSLDEWRKRQLSRMRISSSLSSQAHANFLSSRHAGLEQLSALTEVEFAAMGAEPVSFIKPSSARPGLFNQSQLDQFGRGSIVACLGPAFEVYAGRRSPRIPNGDLLMMSRVISIEGQKRNFDLPASIVTEYDVPEQAWFIRPETFASLPNVSLMEMALQPCGFLSAYLETSLTHPEQEFFFRNLDGQAQLLSSPDLRGKTVTARARLLKTTVSGDIIIQHFEFELLAGNAVFYRGSSSFGYFPPNAMANQAGLDGGKVVLPWISSASGARSLVQPVALGSADHIGRRLDDLDRLEFVPQGGRYQQGYLFGTKVVHPEDWYFEYHFYDDPVMPGSLGIEAVLFAFRAYAQQSLGSNFRSPRYTLLEQEPLIWKYRGQILKRNRQMDLEIHIKKIDVQPGRVSLWGDASLWSDQMRIYEMNQIGIAILEG